ncbi:uncharacterized protein EI90DRAFT_3041472 [Cantharellus anzutake]|uniref:uncharacterized protein n=1 Tax=Cantharellus anzutake TaxID=1750568 RepID=UPI001905B992|nr:uncharacterized protein EI90DRAFT_3041472 [Cantharellus anzutake]KAF8338061.1 hypothetical protein EI90DRAFT_3041472 [Cantharellus anzutake]
MCKLVTFFDSVISGGPEQDISSQVFAFEILYSLAVPAFFLLIDCASLFPYSGLLSIGIPLITGIAYQLKTGGLILPIYYLFSLMAKTTARVNGKPTVRPHIRHVQGAFLAIIIGLVVPTMIVLFNPTPYIIALWQLFPVYIAILQSLFRFVYPPTPSSRGPTQRIAGKLPGAQTYLFIQFSYVILSSVGTLGHLPFLLSLISDNPFNLTSSFSPAVSPGVDLTLNRVLTTLTATFKPHLGPFEYSTGQETLRSAIQDGSKRFLQWDEIFISLSTWLVACWSWAFDDIKHFVVAVFGSIVSAFLFGPAIGLAGPLMYKEWIDEQIRVKAAAKPAEKKE